MEERLLEEMPFDMAFEVNGNRELCHATGKEVMFDNLPGDWWNEYVDRDGNFHYGR